MFLVNFTAPIPDCEKIYTKGCVASNLGRQPTKRSFALKKSVTVNTGETKMGQASSCGGLHHLVAANFESGPFQSEPHGQNDGQNNQEQVADDHEQVR